MTFFDHMKQLLENLRALPPSKAREKAIDKLEECSFWASAAIVGVESPIEYTANDGPKKGSS